VRDQQAVLRPTPTPFLLASLLVIPLAAWIPSRFGKIGYPQTIAGYFHGADIA